MDILQEKKNASMASQVPGLFPPEGVRTFMQLCAFYFHLSPPAWYFCIQPLTYLSIEIPYFMGSFDHVNLRAHLSISFWRRNNLVRL